MGAAAARVPGSIQRETFGLRAGIEYRSRWSLLGLPLIHIRFGENLATRHTPVSAWIAVSDIALGGFLAVGGVAVAPVAVGGFVVGELSFGGIGVGAGVYGGFAFGIWVLGGLVVGMKAFGDYSLGWIAAAGGVAVARQFAQGGIMIARHAGDAAAGQYFRDSAFFNYSQMLISKYLLPGLVVASLPAVLRWHVGRKKHRG